MSNAAKIVANIRPKRRSERTRKVKVDLKKMAAAIVDGRLILPLKSRVFFERTQYGKTAVHEGHIFSVEGDVVTLWDETKGQFCCYPVSDAEHLKSVDEATDGVHVDEERLIGGADKE